GGATLEGAATVAGGTTMEMVDRIGSLVEKNLLVAEEGPDLQPRFRLLETVREDAFEQLRASGEEPAPGDAHARYVMACVEQSWPRLWMDQHDCTLIEHENVRASLRWLLDRGDVDGAGQVVWSLGMF